MMHKQLSQSMHCSNTLGNSTSLHTVLFALQVLSRLDEVLRARGTSKGRLLTAQICVRDGKADLPAVAGAWEDWIGTGDDSQQPATTWLHAAPLTPSQLVAVQVTALV
jgi:enamine deaminase RidA (YjgF/YER057c/UK114 family)